ncbi:hypothetical protein [Methanocaldococcus sp.]
MNLRREVSSVISALEQLPEPIYIALNDYFKLNYLEYIAEMIEDEKIKRDIIKAIEKGRRRLID